VQYEDFNLGQVAVVLNLTHNMSQEKLTVIGNHFTHHADREYVKYFQSYIVQKYISNHYKDDHAVIWGGDLNTKPSDNLIHYLSDNHAPSKDNIHLNVDKTFELEQNVFQLLESLNSSFKWGNLYEN